MAMTDPYRYIIFEVQGWNFESPDGRYQDYSTVQVFAPDREAAIAKADELDPKTYHRISWAIEHNPRIERPEAFFATLKNGESAPSGG